MRLKLTRHLKERMEQRKIRLADVQRCLEQYVLRAETPQNSILYKGPATDEGRMLKVWVVAASDVGDRPRIVKSAAWEDQDDG